MAKLRKQTHLFTARRKSGLGQHFQDLGHSFSLYGPPSQPIYMFVLDIACLCFKFEHLKCWINYLACNFSSFVFIQFFFFHNKDPSVLLFYLLYELLLSTGILLGKHIIFNVMMTKPRKTNYYCYRIGPFEKTLFTDTVAILTSSVTTSRLFKFSVTQLVD